MLHTPRRPGVVLLVGLVAALLLGGAAAVSIVVLSGHHRRVNAAPASSRGPTGTSDTAAPSAQPTPSPDPSADLAASPLAGRQLARSATIAVPATAAPSHDDAGHPTTYGSANLVDGVASTAWRMAGDGSGRELTISWPQPYTLTRLGLVNGYSKRDPTTGANRYTQERRITSVTWRLPDGTQIPQQLRDGDSAMQTVAVPGVRADRVTLHLNTTTGPGDPRFDYTAISEIDITGG